MTPKPDDRIICCASFLPALRNTRCAPVTESGADCEEHLARRHYAVYLVAVPLPAACPNRCACTISGSICSTPSSVRQGANQAGRPLSTNTPVACRCRLDGPQAAQEPWFSRGPRPCPSWPTGARSAEGRACNRPYRYTRAACLPVFCAFSLLFSWSWKLGNASPMLSHRNPAGQLGQALGTYVQYIHKALRYCGGTQRTA
jgi:hypothetical protein